jgi:hypothetical protein
MMNAGVYHNKLVNGADIREYFSVSVSLLLVFTALAKLVAILQHKKFLLLPDPVFSPIIILDSMIIAAIFELIVAAFVFYKRKSLSAMVACSWLTGVFFSYRMLERAFFAKRPCPCLGGILDWTGLSRDVMDWIPVIMLCYIGVGSLLFLIFANASTKHDSSFL